MNSANRLDDDEHRDNDLFRGGSISASLTHIADHSVILDGRSGFGRGISHLARSLSLITEIAVQIA